jgi:hypothetical protein
MADSADGRQRTWPKSIGAVWHEIWKSALTVLLAGIAALWFTPWIQDIATKPTCDAPKGLELVPRSELSAKASSKNDKEQGATYEPSRAIDGDSSTAWVEGIESGANKYGEGESITITLSKPRDVQLVCIINGYARTEDAYLRNARIRQLAVASDVGEADSVLPEKPLEFFAGYQSVTVPQGLTDSVTLTIGTVRAGQDPSQETDTAISEVEIWVSGGS